MTNGQRIELTTRAARDLRRVDAPERRRIRQVLSELAAGAENADVKPPAGDASRRRAPAGAALHPPLTRATAC